MQATEPTRGRTNKKSRYVTIKKGREQKDKEEEGGGRREQIAKSRG